MISTTLMICIGLASATIVAALMVWKPRKRVSANANVEHASWRDTTVVSMMLSFAAAVGLARAAAEQSGDGNPDSAHGWHGSHLDHGASSNFSDGGGGFSGGDSGGVGL